MSSVMEINAGKDLSIYDMFVIVQKQNFGVPRVELFGYKKATFDSLSFIAIARSQAELDVWLSAKGIAADRVIDYSEYTAMLAEAKQTTTYEKQKNNLILSWN